jgi:hypothetical protein
VWLIRRAEGASTSEALEVGIKCACLARDGSCEHAAKKSGVFLGLCVSEGAVRIGYYCAYRRRSYSDPLSESECGRDAVNLVKERTSHLSVPACQSTGNGDGSGGNQDKVEISYRIAISSVAYLARNVSRAIGHHPMAIPTPGLLSEVINEICSACQLESVCEAK